MSTLNIIFWIYNAVMLFIVFPRMHLVFRYRSRAMDERRFIWCSPMSQILDLSKWTYKQFYPELSEVRR